MRDSRITVFGSSAGDPVTISTATTTNGATIDLKSGYVGDYFIGAPAGYGLGVDIIFKTITGTANNVDCFWQVSLDGTTWETDQKILEGELSAIKTAAGTKIEVPTRLRTKFRYARISIVTTTMTSSSFVVQAWVSDGTVNQAYGQAYKTI